jgi:hypothetical protein
MGASHFCKFVVGASRSCWDPEGGGRSHHSFFASLRCSLVDYHVSQLYEVQNDRDRVALANPPSPQGCFIRGKNYEQS